MIERIDCIKCSHFIIIGEENVDYVEKAECEKNQPMICRESKCQPKNPKCEYYSQK